MIQRLIQQTTTTATTWPLPTDPNWPDLNHHLNWHHLNWRPGVPRPLIPLLRQLPAALDRLLRRAATRRDAPAGAPACGQSKEWLARAWLERQGLVHLAHNVRCRQGEVDLVMQDGATLVFVEVRFRRSERFGGAAASVDRRKQTRIAAAAAHYLQRQPTHLPCRFDVLAIGADDQVHWIRHAFDQT